MRTEVRCLQAASRATPVSNLWLGLAGKKPILNTCTEADHLETRWRGWIFFSWLVTKTYTWIRTLVLNADAIFSDRVYLKGWKKADAQLIKVKEELESAKCDSIEFSGRLCSDTDKERCTAKKRNDLLGQEPTTEPVS